RHHTWSLDLLHGFGRELGAWRVARDHDHQDRVLVPGSLGHILEAAYDPGRKRDQIEGLQVHMLELAFAVQPARAPGTGHGNERLVGVMVVEHRTLTRLGATVGEVEAFGNLDGRHASSVQSHRGLLAAAFDRGWLKSDDVVQGALAAGHLA